MARRWPVAGLDALHARDPAGLRGRGGRDPAACRCGGRYGRSGRHTRANAPQAGGTGTEAHEQARGEIQRTPRLILRLWVSQPRYRRRASDRCDGCRRMSPALRHPALHLDRLGLATSVSFARLSPEGGNRWTRTSRRRNSRRVRSREISGIAATPTMGAQLTISGLANAPPD